MTDYWFKRRRYGYGWTPASREGWLVTAGYLILVVGGALVLAWADPDAGAGVVLGYVGIVLLLTVGFLLVTMAKSPAPRWRWGTKPGDDSDEDL